MIPQDTIEQVRQATDILQILGQYVRLKKRGRDFWALCPFHQEKPPSFKVSPDKQFYHCFGCGKGGNVFTFLMEHESMSFAEAVRFLAAKANITIRETGTDQRRDETERLNYAHEVAVEYYHKLLFEKRYAVVLDGYLTDKRGISRESIELFKLGLSGETWDGLLKYASRKDLKPEELVQAGLALKSEQKGTFFDRFRQRLMIPIFNLSQRPIAFGGRTLKKGEPAKYVNSPETPLYNKSAVLYGLNFSRDPIRQANCAYVVEGYFDLISLYQHGIKNVVASSGTAFTAQQARLLARFAEDVYLFFDADSAGERAALRSVEFLFDAGLEVKILVAPPGDDPDTLVRRLGPDGVDELRTKALPYLDFRIRESERFQSGLVVREKLARELAALASKIADPARRGMFLDTVSDKLGVSVARLQAAAPAPPTAEAGVATTRIKPREIELLSLMLHNPGRIDDIILALSAGDFESRRLGRIFDAMATQYRQFGTIDAGRLVDTFQGDESLAVITELAARDWPADEIDLLAGEVLGAFVESKRKARAAELMAAFRKARDEGNEAEAQRLFLELRTIHGTGADTDDET